jgi:cytochrome bd ubiquinol oxidase subunit I
VIDGVLGGPVDQQYLLEARQMQALSFAVHIPLVCFGIAFPAIVLFMEGLWLRTGDPLYKALAKRWSRAMLILFAIGVVTGTILSFELGLLWPEFMATFGAVFGVAFSLEGFSFFVEAIFIAIYVYGWDRLSRRAHFLVGIPIVLAGMTGSLFVISVNGWMNHPEGFKVVNGKVTDVDPFDALWNANLWHELVHMYVAGFIVASFLIAAVYAFGMLRGKRDRHRRVALTVALAVASIAAPTQLLVGDWAARTVAVNQPTKLASLEGLYPTESHAPLHILGWYEDHEVKYGIEFPDLLSILAFHDPDAVVQGLDKVATDDQPPINVIRMAFQTMVFIGTFLALVGALFVFVWWRKKRLPQSKWFLRAVVACGPLSVVALISGWVTTEVGRQPWVVYEFMRTEAAVTGASGIPVGYGTLVVVYLCVATIAFVMLRRLSRKPLELELPDAA